MPCRAPYISASAAPAAAASDYAGGRLFLGLLNRNHLWIFQTSLKFEPDCSSDHLALPQRRDFIGAKAELRNTSSVCSPTSGGRAAIQLGVRDRVTGWPTSRIWRFSALGTSWRCQGASQLFVRRGCRARLPRWQWRKGTLLNAPDVYMQKIAIGPGCGRGVVELDLPAEDNIRRLAKPKGVPPSQMTALVVGSAAACGHHCRGPIDRRRGPSDQ
jgi:fructose-1,6-bisphosphatase glpX